MEVIISIVAGILITVVGGYTLQWLNKRMKKKDMKTQDEKDRLIAQTKMILELQKEIWKLRKTLLIVAKILDDQTSKNHPELASSLEDIATELLRQSDKS